MKRLTFLLLGLLLILCGCDRYEHEVYEDVALEVSFLEFSVGLSNASQSNLDPIMSWYAADYLHDKATYADIEHDYMIIFYEYGDSVELSGNLVEYWETGRITWELKGTIADSSFVIETREDVVVMDSGSMKFYGNQVSPPDLNEAMPVVLVQYFTSTTCGNCPQAALQLEEMHDEYGEQLVVVEYVSDHDPAGTYFPEALSYYGAGTQPTTLIQGEYKIVGAGEADLAEYETRYQQAVNAPLNFRFTSIDLQVSGDMVIAAVEWEDSGITGAEDLRLMAVLLEENPGYSYSAAPSVFFENRVIQAENMPYDAALTSAEIELSSSDDLPDEVRVVVWLQNRPEEWSSAAKVYNVIQQELGE